MRLALLPLLFAQFVFVGGNGQPGYAVAPPAAPAHVQSCSNQGTAGTWTIDCTLSAPVTAGDLLYVCLMSQHPTLALSGLTVDGDSGTATVELADTVWPAASPANRSMCLYVASAGGGETAVGVTGATSYYPTLTVDEFRCSSTCSLDVHDAGASGIGTAVSGNAVTPATNGELVLGYVTYTVGADENYTPGNYTAAGAFTSGAHFLQAGAGGAAWNQYMLQTTASSVAIAGTISNSATWFSHVAAFK